MTTTILQHLMSLASLISNAPLARMAVGVVLAAATKSVPLLLAAALLSACLRRAPAAARHMVWFVAIIGLLALPLLSFWQPRLPRPVQRQLTLSSPLPETVLSRTVSSPTGTSLPAGFNSPQGSFQIDIQSPREAVPRPYVAAAATPNKPSRPAATPRRKDLLPLIVSGFFAVWLAGALALISRLIISLLMAARIARSCVNVSEGSFFALACDMARRLGGAPRFTVRLGRQGPAPAVPMTIGLFAPTVLLPRGAAQWPKDRLEVALLHELAHVRRRDWAAQILASFACALYWVNPLVWLAARRLRVESEMACDDQVLVAGALAVDYAGHLLEMARALSLVGPGVPTAVAAVMRPQIESRLKAILDRARNRRPLSPRFRALALALAIFLLIPLGLLRFQARATAQFRSRMAAAGGETARIGKSLARQPLLAADGSSILSQMKGISPMFSLKPSISKAAAALAGLSLLAGPVPASAQSSSPAAPPAPPVAATPSSPVAQAPAPPNSGSPGTIQAWGLPYTSAPPVTTGKIEAAGGTVAISTPDTPQALLSQPMPAATPPQPGVETAGNPFAPGQGPNNFAQDYTAAHQGWDMPGAVQRVGQNSYNITVMDGSVVALLAQLCRTAGVDFTISGDITTSGNVTVYRHNVSFVDALQSIIVTANPPLTYSVENGVYHFKPKAEPAENEDARMPRVNVTLDLDNAPFDKALKDLCDNAHASYTIVDNPNKSVVYNVIGSNGVTSANPTMQTSVTVHLRGVSFAAALRAILNSTSPALTYNVKDGIIYIRPAAQTGYYGAALPQLTAPTTYQETQPSGDNQPPDRPIDQGKLPILRDIPMLQRLGQGDLLSQALQRLQATGNQGQVMAGGQ